LIPAISKATTGVKKGFSLFCAFVVHLKITSENLQLLETSFFYLKVLTNKKSGGLKVVAFERPPFKLFMLRFSNKAVKAPSCERPKTAQRRVFLLFEYV
jgi:hypothetical protein